MWTCSRTKVSRIAPRTPAIRSAAHCTSGGTAARLMELVMPKGIPRSSAKPSCPPYARHKMRDYFCVRCGAVSSIAPQEVRFWAKVDKNAPGGCWIWTGAKRPSGHGNFTWDGKVGRPHRMAWKMIMGSLPKWTDYGDPILCHKCDDPACVRPKHLYIGTQQQNMRDVLIRGNPKRTKLTPSKVKEMRQLHAEGVTNKDIAYRFDVHEMVAYRVTTRRTWNFI